MVKITIDLRGAEPICSSYLIGRDGENRAEAFSVLLPNKYLACQIMLEFEHETGWKYTSEMRAFKSEILFPIESSLMKSGTLKVGVTCISPDGAVYKPFEREFIISTSTNALSSEGLSYGVAFDHEERLKKIEENRPDMSENNPDAFGYIRNRTHYETEPTTIEWDGNAGDKDCVPVFEFEDDDGTVQYMLYKVADEVPMPEAFLQMKSSDVEIVMSGETVSGKDAFGEDFEVVTLADGKVYMVMPAIAYCTEDNVSVEIPDADVTIVLNKGLWFIRALQYGETMFIKSVTIPGVKQLDLKFIPDVAFATVELKYYSTYSVLTITDRNGNKQSTTIHNGQNGATFTPHISSGGYLSWTNDKSLTNPTPVKIVGNNGEPGYTPVRGTDYWTEEDVQSMKDYIDNAIFNSEW